MPAIPKFLHICWEALKEEISPADPPPIASKTPEAPQKLSDPSQSVPHRANTGHIVDMLAASEESMSESLEQLVSYHKTLQHQVDTLTPAPHQGDKTSPDVVRLLKKTVSDMEKAFDTLARANSLLKEQLQDTRLMLLDRQEDTTDSHTYAKSLEHHMFALRQNHRKTSQLLEHTQQQLRQQEATSVTLQQQHNALQQKYDELVGEYHQLFRKFQDTSGTRRAAAGKPPSIASR